MKRKRDWLYIPGRYGELLDAFGFEHKSGKLVESAEHDDHAVFKADVKCGVCVHVLGGTVVSNTTVSNRSVIKTDETGNPSFAQFKEFPYYSLCFKNSSNPLLLTYHNREQCTNLELQVFRDIHDFPCLAAVTTCEVKAGSRAVMKWTLKHSETTNAQCWHKRRRLLSVEHCQGYHLPYFNYEYPRLPLSFVLVPIPMYGDMVPEHYLAILPCEENHAAYPGMKAVFKQDLSPNTVLGIYGGVLRTEDVDEGPDTDGHISFLTQLYSPDNKETPFYVDATEHGNELRFINDYNGIADDSNCLLRRSFDHNGAPITIVKTRRRVKGGEEALLSYGEEFEETCLKRHREKFHKRRKVNGNQTLNANQSVSSKF